MVAIGTDFDAMMTQAWKQPQPPHLVAINVDPADASKNYRPDVLLDADAGNDLQVSSDRIAAYYGAVHVVDAEDPDSISCCFTSSLAAKASTSS